MKHDDDDGGDSEDEIQEADIKQFQAMTQQEIDKKNPKPKNGVSSKLYLSSLESDVLRNKIKFVSTMIAMQRTLRYERMFIV
jgi:serine/threonine-protein phosphatase 2B catalytic subunit